TRLKYTSHDIGSTMSMHSTAANRIRIGHDKSIRLDGRMVVSAGSAMVMRCIARLDVSSPSPRRGEGWSEGVRAHRFYRQAPPPSSHPSPSGEKVTLRLGIQHIICRSARHSSYHTPKYFA